MSWEMVKDTKKIRKMGTIFTFKVKGFPNCIPQRSNNHITVDNQSLCKNGIEYVINGMALKL